MVIFIGLLVAAINLRFEMLLFFLALGIAWCATFAIRRVGTQVDESDTHIHLGDLDITHCHLGRAVSQQLHQRRYRQSGPCHFRGEGVADWIMCGQTWDSEFTGCNYGMGGLGLIVRLSKSTSECQFVKMPQLFDK
jgi:hypothetical protein